MKGTKEDVAKQLQMIADGLIEIANDILNEEYDPKKWVPLSEKMAPVVSCLQVQPLDFCKNRIEKLKSKDIK